jgi:GGDEF domain-containing protein
LRRYRRDRAPFAALLIEVDVEPVGRTALSHAPSPLLDQLEDSLTEALQAIGGTPAASLIRESPGRYWLLAPASDRLRADALAERLARTVALAGSAPDDATERFHAALTSRRPSRQEPTLRLTIGAAVCPDDGVEAAALAISAEEALSATRAAAGPIISVNGGA